jgi:uncharacterized membrane protein YphA (DoxX/SURF4 family)
MKYVINSIRIAVGVLFIFSGLVKANDPAGLGYKMHEFFDAWKMSSLNQYALIFSILIIAFEIIAGIALLLGWAKKVNLWLLLGLIVFFTFLTAYALFAKNIDGTPKFKACGCFGDCIPLTPMQSFVKDIVLTFLIVLLLVFNKYIQPIFNSKLTLAVMILGVAFSFLIQKYTLDHLPFKDCLSFKVGNNILDKKKVIPPIVDQTFKVRRLADGKVLTYKLVNNEVPDWLNADTTDTPLYEDLPDSTITVVVKEGNESDIIRDFNLNTFAGTDTTVALLNEKKRIHFIIVTDLDAKKSYAWEKKFEAFSKKYAINETSQNSEKLFVVTNRVEAAKAIFEKYKMSAQHILFCDVKPLLAAARTRPTLMTVNNGTIEVKKAYKDW